MTGAAAAAAALGAWSLWLEPRRLVVRREQLVLPAWPAALDGLRVGVLSDLHAGMPHAGLDAVEPGGRRAGGRATRPHLPARRLHRPPRAVRRSRSTRMRWQSGWARWRRRAASSPCSATTTGTPGDGGSPMRSRRSGSRLSRTRRRRPAPACGPRGSVTTASAGRTWTARSRTCPDAAPVLLLSHDPDVFPHVPARVALTLSGHTHGGQVGIPYLRRPFVPVGLRRALRAGPRRRGTGATST